MNPSFRKLLKAKRKRERDPNAPPPPTLLGQVKELRLTKEEVDKVALHIEVLYKRVEFLEARNRRLEITIGDLENFIRHRVK